MSRRKQLPFVLTLRLDRQLAADLQDLAASIKVSRSFFIRRSLWAAVENARRHDWQAQMQQAEAQ
jgi:predicted transcriptional regulator